MSNHIILITGTNSGFGWLHTHTLSAAGHTVYAGMRNTLTSNREKAAALGALPNVHVIELDLSDEAKVKAAVDGIVAKEGRIDVLVNNAGNFKGGIAETFNEHDIDDLFDIHLKATWRTIRAVLPHMRRQGDGLIVNTSSVLGRFSAPFMTFYNAAKFAVEGLSEGLRAEVRQLGIDVSIVEPGAFPTDIFGKSGQGSDAFLAEGYGELASIPEQVGAGIGQYFEQAAPNPQLVADAVKQLVDAPKGTRPARVVVDPGNGHLVQALNARAEEGYSAFLEAFGMGSLLN